MPKANDFEHYLSGFPHVESQLYYPVLDGLALLDRNVARKEMTAVPGLIKRARELADAMGRQFAAAATGAMSHREFLAGL